MNLEKIINFLILYFLFSTVALVLLRSVDESINILLLFILPILGVIAPLGVTSYLLLRSDRIERKTSALTVIVTLILIPFLLFGIYVSTTGMLSLVELFIISYLG